VGFPDENLANLNCFLQMTGCRVSAAKNAMEAVNLMLSKKFAFRSLDLILMGNCVLFLQFMDMFDGAIKLSKKYSFLVVDEFGLQERFKDMLDENKSQHEIEFCSNRDLIDKFQSILRNGTWA
jgi:hypothetical protein